MNKYNEFEKLQREQTRYCNCAVVLGEILHEHPELTQCIQAIGTYVVEKMERNEKRIVKLYGKHGEGLIES